MRSFCYVAVFVLAVSVASVYAEEQELYSDKYDYVDADDILNNDRLRDQYYKCFMDTGPCITQDAVFFKSNFAESIATKCKRCTEKQKQNFEKMVEWYTKNREEEWNAFIKKYVIDAGKETPKAE